MNKEELSARLLATFAEELDDQVRQGNEQLLALERNPADLEQVRSLFRVMHTLKGAARAAGVAAVEQLCHSLESRLAELRDEKRTVSAADIAALFAGLDEMTAVAAAMRPTSLPAPTIVMDAVRPEPAPERRHDPSATVARESTVRVAPEHLDELLASSTRLLISATGGIDRASALTGVADLAESANAVVRRLRRELSESNTGTRRASADLGSIAQSLDSIRTQVSALVTQVSATSRDIDTQARQLSVGVRELRLRPFSDAVSSLPRVVRDVALSTGKKARLEITGEHERADRGVLDEIQTSLMHLVRNAVDHGLESAGDRRRAGKPEEGVIRISARVIGDRLSVQIADDGAGIAITRVRHALAKRGEVAPTDDAAVARRLFSGGITTRNSADAISGRAVGLDAVRAAMERVRGSVGVRWIEGRGTTFLLEAPLSMSTVRSVLARVGTIRVAVPTAYVVRLLHIKQRDIKSVNGRSAVVGEHDTPIPLVSLATLLGPPLVARPIGADETIIAMHIRDDDRGLVIRIDELIGEEELVVRPIRGQGRRPAPDVSGAALLADGTVALVLNVQQLLSGGAAAADVSPAVAATPTRKTRRRLLVADDSITTRTLEASVLEAAGYEVVTAVDGADAWRILEERGADLVVSDVEMPRMDGMQLCEVMRKSTRFRTTPVILVTALETPADRARGLEAGADAYLAKSSFDQQGLLDTVHQLIG